MILFYSLQIIAFMFIAGIFSGVETAFISSRYLKAKREFRKLEPLFIRPDRTLALILAATNFFLVISAVLATKLFLKLGFYPVSFWVSVMLSPFGLIFSEVIPKMLGRHFKERFLVPFLPFIKLAAFFFYPLVAFLTILSYMVRKFWGRKNIFLSRDDIKIMTETIYSQGIIETSEKEAIEDILGLSRQRIKDVFRPLSQVAKIDLRETKDKIIFYARQTRHTRYPVFKDSTLVGYLNIFDIFYNENTEWQKLVRKIAKVSINQRIYPVLMDMVKNKESMAAVFKGRKVVGIVTLSDFTREIANSLAQ
ncbi:MAG: DUF21 domain-containing protein [Candidatus Omnitrophica bacterium]|nr:DUF21 domain-containing protein [Candidatus Omnitrophota bacterium]